MDLMDLLLDTQQRDASDLHLTVGSPPAQRIHGEIHTMPLPAVSRDELHKLLYDMLTDEQKKRIERDHELDFALEFGESMRFRANVYLNRRGDGAVFRVIPTKIMTLDELKAPAILKDMCKLPRGLVLVTGPTGSGKSTTLAAMIDYINETMPHHILTVEDPIEFVHQHKRSLVNQREVGPHTHSFANALRSALREDPDVILVGEMRDLETISLALTAAETGHLVFGTLHTSSAPKTVDRLVDVFPPTQQEQIRIMVAESLQGVVSQCLIPKANGKGRVCAMEIMIGTVAIRSLVRESKTHQIPSIIQVSAKHGMQSLDQQLKQLVFDGVIRKEDALARANNKFMISEGQEDGPFVGVSAPPSGGSPTASRPAMSGGFAAGAPPASPSPYLTRPVGTQASQPAQSSAPPPPSAPPPASGPDGGDDWMSVYGKKK